MLNRVNALMIGLLLSVSAAAGVYKWVDAQGNVHYSDKPQGQAAEKVHIESRPTDPARVSAERQASQEQAQQHTEQREELRQAKKEQKTEAADEARKNAANCTKARERRERYQTAHRLYKPLPDGERQYLSDEEIDKARADADAEVAKWCN